MKTLAYITLLYFIVQSANAQVREIPCIFANTPRGYECRLPDIDISTIGEFAFVGGDHIPPNNDGNVVSFMSTNNNFLEFPATQLVRFPNLQHISIMGSMISELELHSVINRQALTNLDLRFNAITRIEPAPINDATSNIQTLSLQFNRLRSINHEAFAQLPNIQNLDLSFNLFERISAATFMNNPALANIDLNGNRITHINQTFFTNVANLMTFSFLNNLCYSGQFFSLNLPNSRNDMMARLAPCFQNNALTVNCQFGYEFGGVEFENRYTCLLRGVEAYNYDKTITVDGVHMAGRNNQNVTFVWVDSSNVRFIIQPFFTTFVNLEGIQISASNLQVLQPGAFQGANNLRYLTILLNNIRIIENNTFTGAPNLEVIRLWHNNVEEIKQNAFSGLNNLRELHIIGGQLRDIPPFIFNNLNNLQYIDFSVNYLDTVDGRWFENTQNIRQMKFDRNQINAVFPDITQMPFLTSLSLLENVCINAAFAITDDTRNNVTTQLAPCFDNYPRRHRVFTLELTGQMIVEDDDGNIIFEV